MLVCLVGYVLTWAAAALVLQVAVLAIATLAGPTATTVLTLALAAVWQRTTIKRRALRGCLVMLPLSATGWSADRDCLSLGVTVGKECVVTGWAAMSLVYATDHQPVVMLIVLTAMVLERFGRDAIGRVYLAIRGAVTLAAERRGDLPVADPIRA